jgi:hypothetical protein
VRRPGVRGDVVIRGQRLDGEGVVRFNGGDVPADQFILPDPQSGDWAGYASYTRVLSPGCYAYTVKGSGLREVIVFRVVR